MTRAYAAPLLVDARGRTSVLDRITLQAGSTTGVYDEARLRELLFQHPETLPVAEIDAGYARIAPICREINVGTSGYVDVLYATPEGRLAIVETRLWRNPEARRAAIGQILDCAREFSRWSYEDLDHRVRESTRADSGEPVGLYERIASQFQDIAEADFHDAVTRSLRRGDFLLMIVGEGIREDAARLSEFLERHQSLNFTFGLIELAAYKLPSGDLLLQPRILAQSMIFRRTVIRIEGGTVASITEEEGHEPDEALTSTERFQLEFWTEFLSELKLDETRQARPVPPPGGSVYFPMPAGAQGGITLSMSMLKRDVTVQLSFAKGPTGDRIFAALEEERETIESELGILVDWDARDGRHVIGASTHFPDLRAAQYRDVIKTWFGNRLNRFVNAFGPRVQRML